MIEERFPVLHLIDSAGLYGAEKVILTLLKELKGSQYPGILGCIREGESIRVQIATEAEKYGIPVQYFTMRRGLNYSGIQSIRKFIENHNLKLIHSHGYKPNILLSLMRGRKFKTVSTVHGWSKQAAGVKGKLYELLDVIALMRMDRVIAVSGAVLEDLKKYGVKKDRLSLIYNGIKIGVSTSSCDQSSIRQKYGIPPDAFVIGVVGRLAKVKGHVYLLEAMSSIIRETTNCQLVIAGDGPLREEIEGCITGRDLADHVKLLGYIGDINQFMAMIDLFVLPSLSEGLPISLLEAMAVEKPVLASAVGGIPEVIANSDDGVLVPPANPQEISRAICRLILDRDRLSKMSTNSRRVIEKRFSSSLMAMKYSANYASLIAQDRQERRKPLANLSGPVQGK